MAAPAPEVAGLDDEVEVDFDASDDDEDGDKDEDDELESDGVELFASELLPARLSVR